MSGALVISLPIVSPARQAGRYWLQAILTAPRWQRELGLLTLLWPTAETIATRLAAYLTDAIPAADGHGTLLAMALTRGLQASRATGGDDQTRLRDYVRGLLEPLPDVLAWRVWRGTGRVEVWDPLGELDLAEFRRAGPVQVEPWPAAERPMVTTDCVRLMVAARLLDSIDLGCLGGDIRVVCGADGR